MAGVQKREKSAYFCTQEGTKEKLVEMAYHNAKLVLRQDKERIKREEGRTIGAVKEIEALLGLSGIQRMEAYDISNISGFQSVGSMVVYEKGKPKTQHIESLKSKVCRDQTIMPVWKKCLHAVLYMGWTSGKNGSSSWKMNLEALPVFLI